MQWKKSTVFAVANSPQLEFHEWLRAIPAGLDTVKAQAWTSQDAAAQELFLLYGWSTSGADELRRAAVDSIIASGREVKVFCIATSGQHGWGNGWNGGHEIRRLAG